MPGTLPSPAQTPLLFSLAPLPWMTASSWPSQISSLELIPQNQFSVKPNLDVRSLLQVYRIDEAHLPLIQRQNHGAGAHAFSEKSHTLQQVSVRSEEHTSELQSPMY